MRSLNYYSLQIAFLKQDKHLRYGNIHPLTGFGESQIAAEMLACGYENILDDFVDQEIFALHVVSSYVTFYRAEIPVLYWKELHTGLPVDQPIMIKR